MSFGGHVLRPTAAVSNTDGTQTVTFALPEHGGGFAVPVRVGVAPIAGGDRAAPVGASLSQLLDGPAGSSSTTFFRYDAPAVERIVVTRPAWLQPGYVAGAMTPADDNCTFGAGDPFTCNDRNVRQVVILGRGFSAPAGFRAETDPLGLLRGDASMVPLNRFPLVVRTYAHNRILAYTTEQSGTVRVSVSNTLPVELLDPGMTEGRGMQAGVMEQRFSEGSWTNLAPNIAGLQGATTGLPTRGQSAQDGSPSEGNGLTVTVDGLETTKRVRILAGPSADEAVPCRVWSLLNEEWMVLGATDDEQYDAVQREVIDVIDGNLAQGEQPVYRLSFLVPEAPATASRLDDMRIFVDREGTLSSGDQSFGYAQPYVAAVDVWRPPAFVAGTSYPTTPNAPESHWARGMVAADSSIVSVPTKGGWVRVRGQDLTVCPLLRVADGAAYTCDDGITSHGHLAGAVATGRLPCNPGAPGLTAPSLHECFISPVPEGEGDGLQYNDTSMGFTLDVEAGRQSMLLAEDLEDVVAAGVTDGAGGIVPRRAGDGPTAVRLANVVRAQLQYTHDMPIVRQITPVQGPAVPTAGGVRMLVLGDNFGVTSAAREPQMMSIPGFIQVHVAVPSNQPGAPEVYGRPSEWVHCTNATRLDHERIECDLPEGAG